MKEFINVFLNVKVFIYCSKVSFVKTFLFMNLFIYVFVTQIS